MTSETGLRGFRPGSTQTGLDNHKRKLGTRNSGFRKKRDCTIRVAKTKTLISFAVTAKLICVFVFAYAKIRFSHVAAHMYVPLLVAYILYMVGLNHQQCKTILTERFRLSPSSVYKVKKIKISTYLQVKHVNQENQIHIKKLKNGRLEKQNI